MGNLSAILRNEGEVVKEKERRPKRTKRTTDPLPISEPGSRVLSLLAGRQPNDAS
jgi:hypothetical protein